ncbi:hypothetical protein [Chitinimonas naiadis]
MPTNNPNNQADSNKRDQASTASSNQRDDAARPQNQQGIEKSTATPGSNQQPDAGRKNTEGGFEDRQSANHNKIGGNTTASNKPSGDRESRGEGSRVDSNPSNQPNRPKQG